MLFFNDKYEITVKETVGYGINSTDNKYYDLCIKVIDADMFGHYSSYEIEVMPFENQEIFSIIVIAPYCSKVFENSAILTDDIFYIILDNKIIKMDLNNFTYINYLISNPFGTYYEVYNCERGFLVYGELELVLLNKQFEEQWRYCTQDILFGENSLQLNEEYISFIDFEGNSHEVDWYGKQHKYEKFIPKVVTINMESIKTPMQFQSIIKQMLCMPAFYGMNWDAFWDSITGLIAMPDELVLNGWHIYKSIQQEDAELFEEIMKDYNELTDCKHCECIYNRYI